MRVAGIMSGTSLDGIDIAVVDFGRTAKSMQLASWRTTPYPPALRKRLLAVSDAQAHVGEVSRLSFELASIYAKAVKSCGVPPESIQLIGCHGQTIFHERQSTLQIGNGSVLAALAGCPVVWDFRPRDMAVGGRGAPLVPLLDSLLFRDKKLGRVALNIGGIANLTALAAGGENAGILAFDTGPGNMIVDQLVSIHTNGKQTFDKGGRLAGRGSVRKDLLQDLLRNRYFKLPPPKTAGREQYGAHFVEFLLSTKLSVIDLISTATAFTPATIAAAIRNHVPHHVDEVIVGGGGWHNRTMMSYLQAFLPQVRLRPTDDFGIPSDAKEAVAFALLAWRTWHRQSGNVPAATGASRPVICGSIAW